MIVMKTFEEFSDKFFTESSASKELRDSGNLRREQATRSGKIAVTKISIPEVRFAKVGIGEGASAEISATKVAAGKILAVPFHTAEVDPTSVCVFEGMIVVGTTELAKTPFTNRSSLFGSHGKVQIILGSDELS